ncbi:unnamed protein product [Dibothriocephalus latus]|uniref:Protein kinase domain-containing protein n=1 Tax=Dibothriocephalus latus TaxID=60516 RepID=A0A3P6TL17_DIBLA|nr:unnamed protein product [Dibothriocephalus latus]
MGRFGRKLGTHIRDSVKRIFGQKTTKNKYVAVSQNASAEHNRNEVCGSKQDKRQPHSSRPQRLESLSGSVSTLTSTADHYTFRSQEQGYLVEDLSSVEGSNSISTKSIVRANCEEDKNQAPLFASAGDISERSDLCNGKEQPTINIQTEKDSKSTKPDKSQKVKAPCLTRRFEHDLLVCTDEIDGSKLMKLVPRSARSQLESGSNCEDNEMKIEHPAVFSRSITSNKITDRGLGKSHNSKSILKNHRRLKTVEMEEAELEQERLIGGVNNRTAGDGMNASKALFASQKYLSPADQMKIKTLRELNEEFVNLLTKRSPDRHHLLKKLHYEPFWKENGTIDTDAERKSLFQKIQINRCSENISQRSNQGVLRELHNSTTDSNGTLMAHLSLNKPPMKYGVTASTKVCSHKKPVGSKWSNKWWPNESSKCNGIIGCTQMNKKDRVKINDTRQLSGRKDKLKTIESPMTTVVMSQSHNSSSEEVQELSSEQGVLEIGHLNERQNDAVCKQLVAEQEQNQSLADESERSEEVCQRSAGGPLNLCPTGMHEVYAKSKTCVCMHAETLAVLQSKPVISEWHTGEPETILVDGNEVTPRSTLGRKPSLGEFELMKPVRIRSGGQGTVAWVQNPETLMQYALKFKIRDDRNASSWRIERREAKILRNLQYPFVVK